MGARGGGALSYAGEGRTCSANSPFLTFIERNGNKISILRTYISDGLDFYFKTTSTCEMEDFVETRLCELHAILCNASMARATPCILPHIISGVTS